MFSRVALLQNNFNVRKKKFCVKINLKGINCTFIVACIVFCFIFIINKSHLGAGAAVE